MSILDDLAKPQIHEKELSALFGTGFHFHGLAPEFDVPLVCLAFSNRCGSNLLAGYLRDTPCFGGFHEQLNFDTVRNTATTHKIHSFPDYFRHLCRSPTKAGRVYGFKASWDQLMMLKRCKIDRMFNGIVVVHMTRDDIVGQAISLMIADQTKQWTSAQSALSDVTPNYKPAHLKRLIHSIAEAEQRVRILCDMFCLPRTAVTYEQVVLDPAQVITMLSSVVGLDLGAWIPRAPMIKRQANSYNQRFREKFLSDMGDALAADFSQ